MSRKPIKRERRPKAITAEECSRFLDALSAGWSVRHAAERGGHLRQVFYELRDRDEEFAAAWGAGARGGH